MADRPPDQSGQLSPDGMWRWDGRQWVPTMASPPGRSKAWIWWLAAALTVSLLLILVGAGYGIYLVANRFQSGAFTCLPSDFPSYAGTHVVTEATRLGPGLPAGDTQECRMILATNDDVTVVGPYFMRHLNSGDWNVISTRYVGGTSTSQPLMSLLKFRRVSRPQTTGSVEFLQPHRQTEILIVLDS
jgi:hypothetical protein